MSKFKFSDDAYNNLVFHSLQHWCGMEVIKEKIEAIEEAFADHDIDQYQAMQLLDYNVNPYDVVKYLR